MQGPTTGTALVDELIDGVQIGDNLVLQGEAGTPVDLLVRRFISSAHAAGPLVVVTLTGVDDAELPPGTVLLDWSPALSGAPSSLAYALPPGAVVEDAVEALEATDRRVGTGAAYVFDRLTAAQEAWGDRGALDLFLSVCPRLYRRRSLAVWPVDAEAHRPAFLRRLAEVTQVVVELSRDEDQLLLTVRKADGRSEGVLGRTVRAEVTDGDLRPVGATSSARERLGSLIREQRLACGLGQADLARRVGISPSALSQIERGVRGPSGDTLARLWEELGVPFGPSTDAPRGYRISRRSGRDRPRLHDGMIGECVVDDPAVGEVWFVEIAPGASGHGPPFAVKTPEVATVLRGILELEIGGRTETLHEGDAVVADAAPIGGWSNPGTQPTEVAWTMVAR